MATLTVLKFPDPDGAQRSLDALLGLQKQQLITVQDAAVVSWPSDKKKPKTDQLNSLAGVGALSGGFWGLLFGLLFFAPFLGMAIGAGIGALTGSLTDVGIDDDFIKEVQAKVTQGTSALFLLSSDAVVDRVKEAIPEDVELIASNLSAEEEAKLQEVFADA